jgi:hypothetical protein
MSERMTYQWEITYWEYEQAEAMPNGLPSGDPLPLRPSRAEG